MGLMDFISKHWNAIFAFGQFAIFIFTAIAAKNFPTRKEHDSVSRTVDSHAVYIAQNKLEVQQLRADLNDAPTQEAIHELSLQITEFKGDLKVYSERFKSIGDVSERMQLQVDRIDDFLRKVNQRVQP